MKRILFSHLVQCLVLYVCVLSVSPAEAQNPKEESISGGAVRAIQAALQELERRNLDVTRFRVIVWESGSSIYVLFNHPDSPPTHTGAFRNTPSFGVELRRDDLQVIRANFNR